MNTVTYFLLFATTFCVCYGMVLEDFDELLKEDSSEELTSGKHHRSRRGNGLIHILLMLQKSVIRSQSILFKELAAVKDGVSTLKGVTKDVATLVAGQQLLQDKVEMDVATLVAGQQLLQDKVEMDILTLVAGQQSLQDRVGMEVSAVADGQADFKQGITMELNMVKGDVQKEIDGLKMGQNTLETTVNLGIETVKDLLQSQIQQGENQISRMVVHEEEESNNLRNTIKTEVENQMGQMKAHLDTGLEPLKSSQALMDSSITAELASVKKGQSAISNLFTKELKAVVLGQDGLKNNVESEFEAVKGLVNAESAAVKDAQTALQKTLSGEIANVKGGQEGLSTKVASEVASVLAGQNALNKGVSEAINTVKDIVKSKAALLADGQSALKEGIASNLETSAETINGGIAGIIDGQSSLSKEMKSVSNGIAAASTNIVEAVSTAMDEQTMKIAKGQDNIVKGVKVVENILTKETTRFTNPIFGDTVENGVTKYFVQGHIEVLHDGIWGTICDNGITDKVAEILCKMGGYKSGVYNSGAYKQPLATKAAKVWLDQVVCDTADPKTIDGCNHNPWGEHSCNHSADIGIRCFY